MNKLNFEIAEGKCVHCGNCVKDCPSGIIRFDENNIPTITDIDRCIKCQHCLAICPTGAISIMDKKPEDSDLTNNFPPFDSLLNLIQSRKSIRHYKSENLDKYRLDKLKEALKYSPTGCNDHNLHISIIDDIEIMDKFRDLTNSKIKAIFENKKLNFITKKLPRYKAAFSNGNDVIFRGAPHMIVVSSPIDAPCKDIDPVINLSYFELLAQSFGVGTLWCGFAQICLKCFPDLCAFLEIPDRYKPVYVMLFGPTDTKYTRTTQPEEYQLVSVSGENNIKLSLVQKLKRYFWNFIK